ncbi:hypothetical protein SADUNF_Sadunf19G0110100 [Salix dunnii]|uniref:Receptor-like serine/threonine-protein kinase n=1 Tax=Salix dunnii TaxID=1413687 RepID=A0A835MD40_9ROSI|nr:hypothetical protein SADUNF_Sadunf19G0110100 [Salix dunnii]
MVSVNESKFALQLTCVIHSWMMARRDLNQRDLHAMHRMLSTVFFFYVFLLCCSARDTITYPSGSIGNDGQETLVSEGKRYELGFFTPEESTGFRSYLGIWYYTSNPRIVVWVANRNSPLLDVGASFAITEDGNLKILQRNGTSCWSTELETSKPAYREAKLLDSGNLVFGDTNNTLLTTILWQSFADPTDTFLSGMNMSDNLKLISWESKADPKEGKFSFQLDEGRNQFVIFNDYTVHWANGESSDFFSSERMPDGMTKFLLNTPGSVPHLYSNYTALPPSDYNNKRIRLDVDGELQYWIFDVYRNWSLQWMAPRDNCSVFNACGNFGSCNPYNMLSCRCFPGFKPTSQESWRNGDFTGGCSRSSALCGKNDTFLRLKMMRVGQQDNKFEVENDTKCREECLNKCPCLAYSFVKGEVNWRRDRQPINTCLIWTDVLEDLQEEYSYGGPDLFVRVSKPDTELKAKSCEPCGINVIPYPLSTGSDCGDPMYFSFHCNTSTGKLSFKTQNGTYNVTNIDQDTFAIQDKDVDLCKSSTSGLMRKFNLSLPFKKSSFTLRCDTVAGNFGSNISSQGLVEIVIGWEPPPEPVCTSPADCEDWPNSTCKNVTGNGKMRCHCNSNFRWDAMALKCVQGGSSRKKKPLSLIVGVTIASVIVLSSIFLYTCILMRKKAKRRESQQNTERNAALMYGTEKRVKNFIDAEELNEEDKKGIDILSTLSRIRHALKCTHFLFAASNRTVMSCGYMAPEYALDGLFSVKSDVFSFGVVVIEILSGKRNGGYFSSDEAQSLLVYAWRFWREEKALDLMDETLHESCNANEFLRCLNAALLCVQDDPADRPTMSNVVVMLSSETANLPVPKEPAFFIRRGFSGTASTSSKQERGLSAFSSSKQETSIDTTVALDEGR